MRAPRDPIQQETAKTKGSWGGPRPNSGGARAGAGRPRSPLGPRSRDLLEVFQKLEAEGKIDIPTLVEAIYQKAIGGDTGAARELLERRFGKVRYEFSVDGYLGTVAEELEKQPIEALRAFANGGALPASLAALIDSAKADPNGEDSCSPEKRMCWR